jgi:type IV secretion system protein VirD4
MNTELEQLLLLGAGVALFALIYYRKPWRPSSSAHGTARFADNRDLRNAKMLAIDGLPIGRTLGEKAELIRLPRFCHLSIFAPPGAGKGVSLAIPWCLDWYDGSVIALDFKGELFKSSAERRRARGAKIVRLDPFKVCGDGADTYNPLDGTGDDVTCIDAARSFSEAMVQREDGDGKSRHFDDQAANSITAMLAYILAEAKGADRCVSTIREIMTTPEAFEGSAAFLQLKGGLWARLAGVMQTPVKEERASVHSTIHRHTMWLDSPAILPALASGWDARELLEGNVTVYVILPPDQLEAQSRYLRLLVSSLFRLVGKQGMKNGKQCLALLDECGQVGHLQPLEQGLTLLRASGLRIAMFFQSLGQLKEVFKDKESVVLDSTEQIYFGVQSLETAKRVSEMLGNYTESAESYTTNSGTSRQYGAGKEGQGYTATRGSSVSTNVHSRELLKPDEVLQLPGMALIAFIRGVPPILAQRCLYYTDPYFTGKAPKGPAPLWLRVLVGTLFGMIVFALLKVFRP